MGQAFVFDTRDDSVSVNGRMITQFTDGDPVSWAHTQPNSQTYTPTMGKPYRVKKNAPLGNITLRVLPGTPDYKFLLNLANSEAEFPIVVNAQGERVSGTQASFNQIPNGNISENAQVREFVAEVLDYKVEATD